MNHFTKTSRRRLLQATLCLTAELAWLMVPTALPFTATSLLPRPALAAGGPGVDCGGMLNQLGKAVQYAQSDSSDQGTFQAQQAAQMACVLIRNQCATPTNLAGAFNIMLPMSNSLSNAPITAYLAGRQIQLNPNCTVVNSGSPQPTGPGYAPPSTPMPTVPLPGTTSAPAPTIGSPNPPRAPSPTITAPTPPQTFSPTVNQPNPPQTPYPQSTVSQPSTPTYSPAPSGNGALNNSTVTGPSSPGLTNNAAAGYGLSPASGAGNAPGGPAGSPYGASGGAYGAAGPVTGGVGSAGVSGGTGGISGSGAYGSGGPMASGGVAGSTGPDPTTASATSGTETANANQPGNGTTGSTGPDTTGSTAGTSQSQNFLGLKGCDPSAGDSVMDAAPDVCGESGTEAATQNDPDATIINADLPADQPTDPSPAAAPPAPPAAPAPATPDATPPPPPPASPDPVPAAPPPSPPPAPAPAPPPEPESDSVRVSDLVPDTPDVSMQDVSDALDTGLQIGNALLGIVGATRGGSMPHVSVPTLPSRTYVPSRSSGSGGSDISGTSH